MCDVKIWWSLAIAFLFQPGPEVITKFSCSTQLSMKFQLLTNVEIVEISGKFRFSTQQLVLLINVKMTPIVVYESRINFSLS